MPLTKSHMGEPQPALELYLEYGQRIKARCPATQTIAAELTNDSLSYLPTREALAHGHYSAMPASLRLPPEGGDKLVERSVAVLNDIFGPESWR